MAPFLWVINTVMIKLEDNKKFCAAPWTHLHVTPGGESLPCCYWNSDYLKDEDGMPTGSPDFGNINDYDTVNELMNHSAFKDLRNRFLNGETHPGCKNCDTHDAAGRQDQSGRNVFNNQFLTEKTKESVANTLEDGTAEPNIIYLDIRFGNICNLKCRMCGHGYSSSWYEDDVKLDELQQWKNETVQSLPIEYSKIQETRHVKKFLHVDCFDKIKPYIQFAEEIYFAGGEPLLYPEHTKILDVLLETNNTDCRLRYNTNLTSLTYKKKDIVQDYWKKFTNVHIIPSIDGMGDTVEYIRTNMKWDIFVENYNRILKELPDTYLSPGVTIGIMNVEVFPEFNRYCIENGWTKEWLFPNFINYPHNQNIQILPEWYKEKIVTIYEEHMKWIKDTYVNENYDETLPDTGTSQLRGLKTIVDYLRGEIYNETKKAKLLDELWRDLYKWKIISPDQNWTVKMPHLNNFFKQCKDKR